MGTKNNPGEFDCYAKLGDDEPFFVLRANDPLAPNIVMEWVRARIHETNMSPLDSSVDIEIMEREKEKLKEAIDCSRSMTIWREANH